MTQNECDQLFRLLCQLQEEAPCHNMACIGHMNCEYGVNGCYGEECAIEVVLGAVYSKETRIANDT